MEDYMFPTRTGRTYILAPQKVEEFKSTFPGVDVERQLRIAWQWCTDNPAGRKQHQGMGHFLFCWMNRAYKQLEAEKNSPSYDIPYHKKRSDTYLGILRRRYGNLSPEKLLIKSAQHELSICRKCHMAYDLHLLQKRLARYLVSDAEMQPEKAELVAHESLGHEI